MSARARTTEARRTVTFTVVPVSSPPPAHILAAFGVLDEVEPLDGGSSGTAFRFGDTVLKQTSNPAESSWIAATFEQLRISGVRLARPVRASDGRWVVGGWTAQRFVSGRPEPRYDEIIEASIVLHEALAGVSEPRFLRDRDDLYSRAERLAWGELRVDSSETGDGHGGRLLADLAAGRRPVTTVAQVVHGDLFGNVLFAGSAPPAIIDITPYWRPSVWAAAIIAVDALSWGGAQTDLLERWAHLPEWPQMLRRAVMFRLAISLTHPRTTPSSLVEIMSAAEVVRPFLD